MSHKQGYYTEQDYIDEGVKLVRITDIDDFGNTSFNNAPFVPISEGDESAFRIEHGDFIFARSGTIGRFGLVLNPERAVFASYLIRFSFTISDHSYMKYFLLSKSFKESLISNLHGGANQNIHAENIKDQWICIPPDYEQSAVAAFLDRETTRIDTLIAKKERQIELLQEKRAALISHAVTKGLSPNVKMKDSGIEWLGEIPEHWATQRLKFNSYIKGRIGWQNLRSDEFTDEGPYLVTGMHFKDGGVDWSSCYHINEDRYLMAPEIFVREGDVLITKDGSIGKLAYIDQLPEKASLNSHLLIIRPLKNSYNSRYLYYLLGSELFQRFVLIEQKGTTFNGITQESIENFTAIIPYLDEQFAIVTFLDEMNKRIDGLMSKVQESINKLQEYRTALISAAVTGKIDVREEVA